MSEMSNELNILLTGMLDENKSVSNIQSQINSIQQKLKKVNISLNVDDFKKSIESVFGEIESKAKKAGSTKIEFKSLDSTISQIRKLSGELDNIFVDLQKIGNIKKVGNVFETDGSIKSFSVELENINGKYKEISKYNVASTFDEQTGKMQYGLSRVSSSITGVVDNFDKYVKELGKAENASIKQNAELEKLKSNLDSYKLKLSSTSEKNAVVDRYKSDIESLSKLNPLTDEYKNKLLTLSANMSKLGVSTDYFSKLETATIKQKAAIESLSDSINNYKNVFSGSLQGNETATKYEEELKNLQTLNPLTEEYKNKILVLSSSVSKLNAEVKAKVSADKVEAASLKEKETIISKLQTSISALASTKMIPNERVAEVKIMVASLETLEHGTTEFKNASKEAANEITKLTKQSNSLSVFSNVFKTLGTVAMIGSPIMLANRSIRDLVSTVNEFDHSMTEIRIVSGMSYDAVSKLRDGYNELAQSIGATTTEVMDSAVEFVRQGRNISETTELLNASIVGAKLSGIETAEMTEYLTAAVNGYNVSAEKATTVIDKLVAVDNNSASSMSELSLAMSRTSKSAQMVGVDMDSLLGYIGTVSSVTRKSAETIGESMKSIFSRYSNIKLGKFVDDDMVTSDVRKALGNIGIEIMESEETFKSFSVVLDELSQKWLDLSDAERASAANALAGVRQKENFLVLMDNMSMSTELTAKSVESTGLAMDRYGIYLESTEGKLNQLSAAIEGVYIKTLESDTVNFFIEMGISVANFTETVGGLIPVLATLGTSLAVMKNVGGAKCRSLNILYADTNIVLMQSISLGIRSIAQAIVN